METENHHIDLLAQDLMVCNEVKLPTPEGSNSGRTHCLLGTHLPKCHVVLLYLLIVCSRDLWCCIFWHLRSSISCSIAQRIPQTSSSLASWSQNPFTFFKIVFKHLEELFYANYASQYLLDKSENFFRGTHSICCQNHDIIACHVAIVHSTVP